MGVVCEILSWLGGALAWSAGSFGAPILTGLVAGFAIPLAFRWESTPGEVRQHNREAADLDANLRRFVADLGREVEALFREFKSAGRRKVIERNISPDYDEDAELREGLRDTLDHKRWREEGVAAMEDALHRYRDEALRSREKFLELVESESRRHQRRRARENAYPALQLSPEDRRVLAAWRKRPDPFGGDRKLEVEEDLTDGEILLEALETEDGLTWVAAGGSSISADR